MAIWSQRSIFFWANSNSWLPGNRTRQTHCCRNQKERFPRSAPECGTHHKPLWRLCDLREQSLSWAGRLLSALRVRAIPDSAEPRSIPRCKGLRFGQQLRNDTLRSRFALFKGLPALGSVWALGQDPKIAPQFDSPKGTKS